MEGASTQSELPRDQVLVFCHRSMPDLKYLRWSLWGLVLTTLLARLHTVEAMKQRIDLYRENAELDANSLRRLDNLMVKTQLP